MPPKPDADEATKKKPQPIIIDGVDILELTFPRIQELTLRLYEKLLNTRGERMSLQVERDKLRAFWEITQQEIDLCRAKCLLKDNELQNVENESNRMLKEINQEIKYMGYHHNQNISNQHKADTEMFSRVDEDMAEEEIQLLTEKRNLKEKYRDIRFANENELGTIREQNLNYLFEVKYSTEKMLLEVEKGFNDYIQKMIDQLTLKHEIEMAEVEERKNGHITKLKEIHKFQFQELKGYYNLTSKENLMVISNLKENIDKIKNKEAEMANEVKILLEENKDLQEQLEKTLAQVKELKRILSNYEKDLGCLYATQSNIQETEEKINKLQLENETVCVKIKELKESRANYKLSNPVTMDLKSYQQICNLEDMVKLLNLELKSKLKILNDVIDKNPEKRLEIINFLKKNCLTVEDLQYELSVVCKAHDDVIRSYERKLEQFGVDKSKLAYKPLLLENIGLEPASLVTKNL